jgi:HSP20 family protein
MAQRGKTGFYSTLEQAQGRRDRTFGAIMVGGRWVGASQYQTWHPPTDVHEMESHYVVQVEVAGMKESDFSISLSDRTLIIAGIREDPSIKQACHQIEISYGEFRSEVSLPGPVDQDGIEATYADGFLKIVLPKKPVKKVSVVQA